MRRRHIIKARPIFAGMAAYQRPEFAQAADVLHFFAETREIGQALGEVTTHARQATQGERRRVKTKLSFDQLQQRSGPLRRGGWRQLSASAPQGASLGEDPRVSQAPSANRDAIGPAGT